MRLWSLHPSMLDRQGLLAAWYKGLLAQLVIVKLENGEKPAYRNHPQMKRFLSPPASLHLIGNWLTSIQKEGARRGYVLLELANPVVVVDDEIGGRGG